MPTGTSVLLCTSGDGPPRLAPLRVQLTGVSSEADVFQEKVHWSDLFRTIFGESDASYIRVLVEVTGQAVRHSFNVAQYCNPSPHFG